MPGGPAPAAPQPLLPLSGREPGSTNVLAPSQGAQCAPGAPHTLTLTPQTQRPLRGPSEKVLFRKAPPCPSQRACSPAWLG